MELGGPGPEIDGTRRWRRLHAGPVVLAARQSFTINEVIAGNLPPCCRSIARAPKRPPYHGIVARRYDNRELVEISIRDGRIERTVPAADSEP